VQSRRAHNRLAVGYNRPPADDISAAEVGRFETKWLCRPENLAALADLSGQWIDKVHERRPPRVIVLDMASSESPTYGEPEGSAYNGHFGCTCYLTRCSCSTSSMMSSGVPCDPAMCTAPTADVRCWSRWSARYRGVVKRLSLGGDAAFANLEMYEFLGAEDIGCDPAAGEPGLAGQDWIPAQAPGWPPAARGAPPLRQLRLSGVELEQAATVVAKVEWHPGELYPRVRFIVTNLARPAECIVAFYNRRGIAGQWIKEGKGAITRTRLS
jgi:hypothetical protein